MQKPMIRENVSYQEVDDEVVLFNRKKQKIYRLNRTASLIFFFCDGDHAEQDILHELTNVFEDVEPSKLTADLNKTLEAFKKEAIIC